MHVKRGLLVIGVTLSVLAIGFQGVGAQTNDAGTANGFRVSPVRSELTIEKGESQVLTITVENPSNVATTARAIVNDFVASDDESGTPRLILDDTGPTPKNDFKSLVGAIDDVTLAGGEKKDIDVRLSVPSDANSGGYYGAVRFVSQNQAQQGNVGLTASVGSIMLITVPGDLVQKVSLEQLSAGQNNLPKSFITSGTVQIITRLKNEGDIHVKPFGKVEIKNTFGKIVASYDFNNTDPRANILPESTRMFVDNVDNVKWFGRYTILINLAASNGSGDIVTASSAFWYVPVWAIYTLIGIVIVIAVGIYLLARKMRKRSK